MDALERECGRSFIALAYPQTVTELRDAAVALASREMDAEEARAEVGALKVSDLGQVSIAFANDLPSMYDGYLPDTGGTTADQFVCFFAGPPWCWPPDVTLRQSFRHLRLLNEAFSD